MSENPPAFPWLETENTLNGGCGMTLRDYFAGQALAGLMFRADGPDQRNEIAAMVYAVADAMLAARSKP